MWSNLSYGGHTEACFHFTNRQITSRMVFCAGGATPDRLGIVRHAFTPHDEDAEPLAASIARLPDGTLAVGAKASDPASRIVIDEYSFHPGTGEYRLQRAATDLFRSGVWSDLVHGP